MSQQPQQRKSKHEIRFLRDQLMSSARPNMRATLKRASASQGENIGVLRHPTKKNTRGRQRHYKDDPKLNVLTRRYQSLLHILYKRAGVI
jgi:hypothetical protein